MGAVSSFFTYRKHLSFVPPDRTRKNFYLSGSYRESRVGDLFI